MRWQLRASVAGFLAVGLMLACPGASDAAMWLRITTDPVSPRLGEIAHVTVATMVASTSYCVDDPRQRLDPWSRWFGSSGSPEFNFKLNAEQNGRVLHIPLSRRDTDPAYWDGRVVFPTAGVWVIRMVYPTWSDESCAGARITVHVRDESGLPAMNVHGGATSCATPEFLHPVLCA